MPAFLNPSVKEENPIPELNNLGMTPMPRFVIPEQTQKAFSISDLLAPKEPKISEIMKAAFDKYTSK